MKKFIKEFGAFINRGNVFDMAVGVIIGAAFGKIVTSLVENIITPAISMITGKVNIAALAVTLPAKAADGTPIVLAYGAFLQSVIDFLIIALCIFFMIKAIGKLHLKKEEEKEAAPAEPTKEEVLLMEIRDLLAAQTASSDADDADSAQG